jgi:hypothetical protein
MTIELLPETLQTADLQSPGNVSKAYPVESIQYKQFGPQRCPALYRVFGLPSSITIEKFQLNVVYTSDFANCELSFWPHASFEAAGQGCTWHVIEG